MKITILAAGAAGMYCGSCMRDNTLAAALTAAGEEVRLLPLFTPLRTDEADQSLGEVFYGGINVFLEQAAPLFRRTPRALDWLWDRPALLRLLGRIGASTDPEHLGATTVSILAGQNGRQRKELDRLVGWLEKNFPPDVVCLPNAMFLGLAEPMRQRLGATVLCELTGEDAFLAGLPEQHRREAHRLIRQAADVVHRFVATSGYYADRMADYLAVPRERIEVVWPGVHVEDFLTADLTADAASTASRPPTVAYLARVCPEKGLDLLVRAMLRVRRRPALGEARLIAAGWIGRDRRRWLEEQMLTARADDEGRWFDYRGEVDRAGKRDLLAEADVLCVPAAAPEAKGLYVLEGWAAALPFVGFDHGSFAELVGEAGGGVLTPPGDADALADALADLLADPARRAAMGAAGRRAVLADYTAAHMARRFLDVARKAAP